MERPSPSGSPPVPVRLYAGRHRSPAQGACVMELATMLAGEPFGDRPRCVDPVLAAFMRGLNDRLGEHSRQRLEPYARLAIGTRTDRAAARGRRDRCLAFAAGTRSRPRHARLRVLVAVGLRGALRMDLGATEWALRVIDRRGLEPTAFPLLEELLRPVGAAPPFSPDPPVAAAVEAVPERATVTI